MRPEDALRRLQDAVVRRVPLSDISTDDVYQPREQRMVPFREQGKTAARSEAHSGTLRLALEGSPSVELEPLLVADINGALYVVDGHHRLRAYRLAKRPTVPARVTAMTQREAVMASKLANCTDRALEMHPEQKRDAAWQYLAAITKRGTQRLPKGESLRSIAGRFGIGKDTAGRMLKKLPQVNLKEFTSEALDPGTDFPRWRYVRMHGSEWNNMREQMTAEQLTRHEAENLARKIGGLLDKATPDAGRLALNILKNEAKLAAADPDTKAFMADIADPEAIF